MAFNQSKGILLAVSAFILMHYSIRYVANSAEISQDNYIELISWLNFAALSIYFVSGLLASMFYNKNLALIGMVTGLLASLSAIILFGVSVNDTLGKLITVITGMVLGGFGGVAAMFIKSRIKNVL